MNSLLKKDDYWAIWLGFGLLLTGLIIFMIKTPSSFKATHERFEGIKAGQESRFSFRTIAWYEADDQQKKFKAANLPVGKFMKQLTTKPGSWQSNPIDAFWLSEASVTEKKKALEAKYLSAEENMQKAYAQAIEKQQEAKYLLYQDSFYNRKAGEQVEAWRVTKSDFNGIEKQYNIKPYNKIPWLLGLMFLLGGLFTLGATVMGEKSLSFFLGFCFIFFIGLISYLLAGQTDVKTLGIGYAAWAIILGLLISNTVGTPEWVKPSLSTAFYIKTGLVLLGAEILLSKILAIGLPGLFVAWVVTPIVLVSTYWFGQKVLGIRSKTLNMTISADMSVCGVSAAVATAAACKASKEELTLAIGLSMAFTSVMMVVMPLFINFVGMPEVLGGAWIGGTIDATGAVVAAGAFLGEDALSVAATIKMIQNILIGVIAFGVAVYFATKVENTDDVKVGWGEIWKRFPKFILGFIGASILFSIVYAYLGDNMAYAIIDEGVLSTYSKNIRGWLFCLAFVSIGLSTNFKELKKQFSGGKPLILYLCGQTLNLLLTLLMAYIMFYLVFPEITAGI